MSHSHSEECLSSNRFGDGFDCIGYPRCHLAPKPKVDWQRLRDDLKRYSTYPNKAATLTVRHGLWPDVGLEALGFVFHPEQGMAGLWVYTFDQTPPDPNG